MTQISNYLLSIWQAFKGQKSLCLSLIERIETAGPVVPARGDASWEETNNRGVCSTAFAAPFHDSEY